MKKLSLFCVFLCFIFTGATAQNSNVFNLNIHTGLPANHVYTSLTDHNGYLWLATTNGVVKYNGYEVKIFTTSDGLPTDDVWQLVEDTKGRIWLGCIANKIGYIYNDVYHSATFADTTYHNNLYPMSLSRYGDDILFYSIHGNGGNSPLLHIERHDTIFSYNVIKSLLKFINGGKKVTEHAFMPFYNQENGFLILDSNYYYPMTLGNNGVIFEQKLPVADTIFSKNWARNWNNFIGNYVLVCYFNSPRNYILALNTTTGKTEKVQLKNYGIDEPVIYVNHIANNNPDNNTYLFTENWVLNFQVKDSIRFIAKYRLKNQHKPGPGFDLTSFRNDMNWGMISTTKNHGVNIKYDSDTPFRIVNADLTDYTYLGPEGHPKSFWINSSNSILCIIDKNLKIEYIKLPGSSTVNAVQYVGNDQYLLLGAESYYLNNATKKVTRIETDVYGSCVFKIIADAGKRNYCLSTRGFYSTASAGYDQQFIDYDRFREMIYDSFHKMYWVYNQNKILVRKGDKSTVFDRQKLSDFGVDRVETICVDNKYGNIFIKGNAKVVMVDIDHHTHKEIFESYNLKESSIHIRNDLLVAYGRSGVIFSKITGSQKLSQPVIYRNIKNTYYEYIYGAHFAEGKMLINTNQGVYCATIPEADSLYSDGNQYLTAPSKFLCYYKNKANDIDKRDTILVDPSDMTLRFDVINPNGNGAVTYNVSFQGGLYSELNAREYIVRGTTPDNYYTVSLKAYDKVWRSKPITFTIYVQPKWYQTHAMTRIIWLLSVVSALAVIAISVLITRRLVLNATKKRNMRMELELKSIYAQINPHFIFNSLNSALLLVSKNKTEEAYSHISKFSKLLRSYIKSSRNKLILLNEEVKNLTNYIDLQQVRFKNKFNYEITLEDGLAEENIYIPSLLLQPFVENAIEHGLLGKDTTGNLVVSFSRSGDKLVCTIDDDGIGRKESKANKIPNPIKDESYGELLIKDLVTIFNRYEHMNIHIDYHDKQLPETGTIVTIYINAKTTM